VRRNSSRATPSFRHDARNKGVNVGRRYGVKLQRRLTAMSRRSSALASGGGVTRPACASCRVDLQLVLSVIEITNAQTRQGGLHPINDPRALADELLVFPRGPLGVVVFDRRRWSSCCNDQIRREAIPVRRPVEDRRRADPSWRDGVPGRPPRYWDV
jgi:hypothetical protein